MSNAVIYPGSFDPITKGHLDVIERSGKMFDQTTIGVGQNIDKKYLFTFPERVHLIQWAISQKLRETMQIEITPYSGLLVDFAKEEGVNTILRGLRNASDLESESLLHWVGESQKLWIDTIYMLTKQDKMHVSSSTAKAILKEQGQIEDYVTLNVKHALEARMMDQYFFWITGTIGSGKSYVTDQFVQLGEKYNIPVHNIDLDKVGHKILGEYSEPGYVQLRQRLASKFWSGILDAEGFVDRKVLWPIVFNDPEKRKMLDAEIREYLTLGMRKEIKGKKGIILLNGALLAEWGLVKFANNNSLLIDVDPEIQRARLRERGHTDEQVETRIKSQFSTEMKQEAMEKRISEDEYGNIVHLHNNGNNEAEIEKKFNEMLSAIDIFGALRMKSIFTQLGIEDAFMEVYTQLKSKYDTPSRVYHDRSHIVDCMNKLYHLKPTMTDEEFQTLFLAFLFHDVVYESMNKRGTNERQSAVLAAQILTKLWIPEERIAKVCALIEQTATLSASGDDIISQYMHDIDVSILGTSRKEYEFYMKRIRFEYSIYPDKRYIEGRLRFLKSWENRDIFYTPYFKQKYEQQARANIQREILILEAKAATS